MTDKELQGWIKDLKADLTRAIQESEDRTTRRLECLEGKLLGNGLPGGLVTRVAVLEHHCKTCKTQWSSNRRRVWDFVKLTIAATLGAAATVLSKTLLK